MPRKPIPPSARPNPPARPRSAQATAQQRTTLRNKLVGLGMSTPDANRLIATRTRGENANAVIDFQRQLPKGSAFTRAFSLAFDS